MLVIPALDLREGKCVRLYQGEPGKETVFSENPVSVARYWCEMGAPRLHVVDLDGAFRGRLVQLDVIARIIREVNIPVQVGGGIRSLADIEAVLSSGAQTVIIGTAAVNRPGFIREAVARYPGRVMVGIDTRDGKVAIEGWGSTVERSPLEVAEEVKASGVSTVVYTDIRRDGTMRGPNLEGISEFARNSGLRVIASGGISSLEDVQAVAALAPLGVSGMILGRAIYEGAISLAEAIGIAAKERGQWPGRRRGVT